jgi:hypothetical protein
VKKASIARFAAIVALLTVLFTQVGLNFLHAHAGQRVALEVALNDAPESGNASCPVCKMDGILALCLDYPVISLPDTAIPAFAATAILDVIVPAVELSAGRAPPIC